MLSIDRVVQPPPIIKNTAVDLVILGPEKGLLKIRGVAKRKPRNFGSASGQQLAKYTPVTWAIHGNTVSRDSRVNSENHFPIRDISVHWASAAWPPVMFVDRNLPNQFLELCRNQLSYQESVMS